MYPKARVWPSWSRSKASAQKCASATTHKPGPRAACVSLTRCEPQSYRPVREMPQTPTRLPALPSLYSLPWDRKSPMYPHNMGRGTSPSQLRRNKQRPIELQSMFGMQVDSRRESPVGVVFANGPLHGGKLPSSPPVLPRRKAAVFSTPSPLEYRLVPSCGPQPLSSHMTASRVSLHQTEDRWDRMERYQRANMTPAPNAYFPR